jgi:hypothetical protein
VNINDKLSDELIDDALSIEKKKKAISNKFLKLLKAANQDILSQIAAEGLTEYKAARLNALSKRIAATLDDIYSKIGQEFTGDLESFVSDQLSSLTEIHNNVVGTTWVATPSKDVVYAAAYARPYQGKLLKKHFSDLPVTLSKAIDAQLRIGYVNRETQNQIFARVKRVIGKKQANFGRSAVNTAIAHFQAVTAERFINANKDAFSGKKLVATVDLTTTDICMFRDGRVYRIGKEPPLPFHFNERSLYAGQLKAASKQKFNVPERTRASMDGQISSDINLKTWIDRQSFARQSKRLGRNKAILLRDTDLKAADLFGIDRILLDSELRVKFPVEYAKALGV